MPDTWSTNSTLEEIAAFLRPKRRVIVTTHLKPDGDAVGSSMALVRALNAPGPWGMPNRAEAWYTGPTPPWLKDIVGETPHRVIGPGGPPDVDGLDAVVVVDTGSWTQLEPLREWLSSRHAMVSIVDHHVQGDAAVAPRRHIDTQSAAACQPVGELCRLLLNVPTISALPQNVADMLYLGLATDTGWFRHSNVTKAVMNFAGELLDAKADNVRLYQILEQCDTVSRLRLLSRALATLELHDQDRIAVMTLTREDFKAAHAQPGESGGFVDFGQAVTGVLVTALLTEAAPGEYGSTPGPITKISMRSKVGVDVNAVAKTLGGGGHVQAAGARVNLEMDAAKKELVRRVSEQLKK